MDMEFRLTRLADQFGPAKLQIAKDREGPVFVSRETDNMFILTAKLTGYKRGNIKIDINKARNLIGITGARPVQETIIVGIRVYTKDIVIKSFKKGFKIPDRLILDKINAKFNDLDSVLTITMPKMSKGIRGYGIEEVDDQEIGKESETLQIADDESKEQRVLENAEELERDKSKGKQIQGYELDKPSNSKPMAKNNFRKDDDKKYGMYKDGAGETQEGDSEMKEGAEEPDKKSSICAPVVAGSALLISLVVFVFHMIRSKDHSKEKD